ncbi:hypothetical protein DDT46_00460 [Mycobacteroides abscessus]|uniref:hypothetical protein n=1 Tax=Mycobacteroides abscessus TaxID=36809 RepID=UPI000D52FA25|nr:hypothetical protein [Mycobacteroides abscessus]AWG62445.1 hypothetical protein DDT46_00460 [Mycobacteroides abscessus]
MNTFELERREAAFQKYLKNRATYEARVMEGGKKLPPGWNWHSGDIDAQRELFMRRYRNN